MKFTWIFLPLVVGEVIFSNFISANWISANSLRQFYFANLIAKRYIGIRFRGGFPKARRGNQRWRLNSTWNGARSPRFHACLYHSVWTYLFRFVLKASYPASSFISAFPFTGNPMRRLGYHSLWLLHWVGLTLVENITYTYEKKNKKEKTKEIKKHPISVSFPNCISHTKCIELSFEK